MDTTLHTARTRHGLVRNHTPTQPQQTVSNQPPKLHALSPAAAPPLLARAATAPGNRVASAPTLRSTDAGAVSRPGECHPEPLAERCVNLSIHTAIELSNLRIAKAKDCIDARTWDAQELTGRL